MGLYCNRAIYDTIWSATISARGIWYMATRDLPRGHASLSLPVLYYKIIVYELYVCVVCVMVYKPRN